MPLVTLLEHRILRRLLDFWKNCAPLIMSFWLAQNAGNFLKAQRLLDSLQGLLCGGKCFILLVRNLMRPAAESQATTLPTYLQTYLKICSLLLLTDRIRLLAHFLLSFCSVDQALPDATFKTRSIPKDISPK
jgi:hypothetical protein